MQQMDESQNDYDESKKPDQKKEESIQCMTPFIHLILQNVN
jgi:hypothetical protein